MSSEVWFKDSRLLLVALHFQYLLNKAAFTDSTFDRYWKKHALLSQSNVLFVQMFVLWSKVNLKNSYLGVRE